MHSIIDVSLDKDLSMPPVLNILGFWLAQDSEYVSVSECARVLDIPGFWICLWYWIYQDSEYYTGFRICLNNSWICADMPHYVWIFLNMTKSVWMAFILHFPCSYFALHVVIYLNVYRRLDVIVWRNMRLFSWGGKIWFFL